MLMAENEKIAAIGPRSQVLALKSVGVRTCEVESLSDAKGKLDEMAGDDSLRLILISEELAEDIGAEAVEDIRERTGKIIMAVPSHEGTSGLTALWLKEAMERSIGVDLMSD